MINRVHYTLFISDLHLQPQQQRILEDFINLLKAAAEDADAIYILGDLFEAWIGDDEKSEFNELILTTLKEAHSRGLAIYIMRGNRDFLLGSNFARACGAKLLADPCLIDLYGKKFLLMHGDSLCTFDKIHQLWFKLSRHPYNERIAKFLPLSLRQFLSKWMRSQSKKHQKSIESYKLDVNQETVTAQMFKHQVQLLIHGHTHQPAIHHFENQDKTYTRIVLGSWHDSVSVLKIEESGNFYLLNRL